MVTYNNIIDYFKNFADNHFFIHSFTHGNIEEADLAKEGSYPFMHVNYTGSTYDENETYNFEVYVLGLPPDKLDKIAYQTEVISDCKQCLEDLLADIKLTENIFNGEVFDLVSASMTPLEEETKNVLSGMVLDLSFQLPYNYDGCDAPLTGVTPTPSGDCLPVRVVNSTESYDVTAAAGTTLVLSDNTVTDVNGTTRDVPAQTDVTCAWTTLFVVNSDEDILATAASYPASNRILSPDITLTQVDGSEGAQPSGVDLVCTWTAFNVVNTSGDICVAVDSFPLVDPVLPKVNVTDVDGTQRSEAACVDIVCAWSDITLKDSEGTTLDVIESYPSGGEFVVPVSSATAYPFIIAHRVPSYTTGNPGDYPTLFAASYFDLFFPSTAIQMIQLGADNFTLAANNRFGNTSRYTATDGTPSDTGTARFSSYGSGVSNIVRDNLTGVMWYNLEISASITWDNAQAQIDSLNTASLGGFTDWIRPTRDMITISAIPDNNQDSYLSPNLFISDTTTALRRYMTCELAAYSNLGFFVASNGGEASQGRTTTASGQNRVVAARLMTLSELFG